MCRKPICVITSVLLLSLNASAASGKTALSHHWNLDEASPPYVDNAGGADATGTNLPKSVVGLIGSALEFDGIDDEISASHPDKWDWGAEDSFTMTYWTKTTPGQASQTNNMVALARQGTGANQLHWWIGCAVNTWQAYFQLRDTNRVGERVVGGPALNDGNWHLVTAVRDDSENQNRLYVDGEFVGRLDWDYTAGFDADVPFTIGHIILSSHNYRYPAVLDDIRVYERALSEDQARNMFDNILPTFSKAYAPAPADGANHEAAWVNLSWSQGDFAVSHDVYVGDNFDDVRDATNESDAFCGNQAGMFIVAGFPGFAFPEGLVPGTTYYWRIDEVNEADPNSPWKGDIWSFLIPPKTAYNPDPADKAEFVGPDNTTLSWTPGLGAKLHTVYLGDSFVDVNDGTITGVPMGTASYNPGPLQPEEVYYWRVDDFDGFETHKGNIWSFTTPGAVGNPHPANGKADVQMIETLSWTSADNATSHELYFGTEADAVNNATTVSPEYIGPRALGAESYDPGGLAWDSSYAWRVDEVYPTGTVKGITWTFATADFLLVDDFESYNDIDPPDRNSNRIFDKWIDGYGTTTNGALIGNDLPPYAETSIVHGGAQSMIYRYDNNLKTSEATLSLVYPIDWTEQSVAKLSIRFRGNSGNSADRIFVALGNAVVYHSDPAATQTTGWSQWVIDLTEFAGVDLTNVNAITIGIGTKNAPSASGDTGTMYFDDIRLIR